MHGFIGAKLYVVTVFLRSIVASKYINSNKAFRPMDTNIFNGSGCDDNVGNQTAAMVSEYSLLCITCCMSMRVPLVIVPALWAILSL